MDFRQHCRQKRFESIQVIMKPFNASRSHTDWRKSMQFIVLSQSSTFPAQTSRHCIGVPYYWHMKMNGREILQSCTFQTSVTRPCYTRCLSSSPCSIAPDRALTCRSRFSQPAFLGRCRGCCQVQEISSVAGSQSVVVAKLIPRRLSFPSLGSRFDDCNSSAGFYQQRAFRFVLNFSLIPW
ncbi:hypothetical protein OUZ56_026973 [Daphnia magna]|uniref:Uncharacterized protein n=1 Tax=Daphnia magna TaxID=35525 RepID=A0ABQ9ZND9_9CRUS|nr:hypothetical protein OUZ56_026973 [Daphnia magna]